MSSPPSCTLPAKKPLSIAGRIWLSFSLLLLGYTVLMLQGAWVGSFTQEKNELISSHLFPAALKAQSILTNYKEQTRQLEEAILSGEIEQLEQATQKSAKINEKMVSIIADKMISPAIIEQCAVTLDQYQQFIATAIPIYTRMLAFMPDETMLQQAATTSLKAQHMLESFSKLEEILSSEMKTHLRAINLQNVRHKQISITVFVVTVGLSIIIVSFILSRTILSPLRETVELANSMAEGDLSRKLTIHRHDEIGELAKAMNIMAGELESYYSDMEGQVKQRTIGLEQANMQMGREVEQRKRTQHELIKALEAAKSSVKAKSAFLANMSHEIRTPMNGIIGMSSLLTNTELTSSQQRYTSTIKNSAEALLQIINDILDFSKVEAGKLELDNTNFNPHNTIAFVTELFSAQAREKGLNLFTLVDSAVPTIIYGDEGRLRQVILNLVGNAIKFTQAGEIAIRVKAEKHEGEQITIRFAISDTGIGIPKKNLEKLFQPFTQADVSTTRKFGGTGLGLSICQRLVELMHGKISAESNENEGSTFWFTVQLLLPHTATEEKTTQPATGALVYSEQNKLQTIDVAAKKNSPDPRLLGKNILIADDDATNIIVTEAILESMGCQTTSVMNGQEAVSSVSKHDYDLILMDSQMPILSGTEATKAIRRLRDSQNPQLIKRSKTPVIALTADAMEGARKRYIQAGMDDYLSKPIRPETLQSCLARWLVPSKKATIIFPRKRLLKRLGGDEDLLLEIITNAKKDIPPLLAEIKKACINNDYSLVSNPCQTLKNIGADLGIAAVQHHALHLCLAAENKKCDPAHLKEFEMVLLDVINILNEPV